MIEFPIDSLSDFDKKPIKTRLSLELKNRLKTKNQWLVLGREPVDSAIAYSLHPSSMNKLTCDYFLDTETEATVTECCGTCKHLSSRSYCEFAGSFPRVSSRCSEYDKR